MAYYNPRRKRRSYGNPTTGGSPAPDKFSSLGLDPRKLRRLGLDPAKIRGPRDLPKEGVYKVRKRRKVRRAPRASTGQQYL